VRPHENGARIDLSEAREEHREDDGAEHPHGGPDGPPSLPPSTNRLPLELPVRVVPASATRRFDVLTELRQIEERPRIVGRGGRTLTVRRLVRPTIQRSIGVRADIAQQAPERVVERPTTVPRGRDLRPANADSCARDNGLKLVDSASTTTCHAAGSRSRLAAVRRPDAGARPEADCSALVMLNGVAPTLTHPAAPSSSGPEPRRNITTSG
jgi:hypothetical protein